MMSFAGKKEFLRFLTFHVRCQFDFVAASATPMKDFGHLGMFFLGSPIVIAFQGKVIMTGTAAREVTRTHSVSTHGEFLLFFSNVLVPMSPSRLLFSNEAHSLVHSCENTINSQCHEIQALVTT
jgi:hypothetical protein